MGQPLDKETLDDMKAGIVQAEEMMKNMQEHGTIDAPKDLIAELQPRQEAEILADMQASTEAIVAQEAERMRIQQLLNEAADDGRKLVTVRTIDAIDDIPGADLIKLATIEGWEVVVKAGEFKPGDKCVYFETDSYLPMSDERFKFLEKNAIKWQDIPGARLKLIRLRGQRSQGLALPVSAFPEVHPFLESEELRDINFTGAVGIFKWEKVLNAQLAGQAKGGFPSFLRKSDQERCQNMVGAIFGYEETYSPVDITGIPYDGVAAMTAKGELVYRDGAHMRVRPPQASRDTRYEVSLKMDGSSMTIYRRGVEGDENDPLVEGVCSRNLDLKMEGNDDNAFVKMANSGLLQALGEVATNIAVQGELMGPGIQGNREGFKSDRFFVYNVFDIESGEFMTPAERHEVVREMQQAAKDLELDIMVEHVPCLHHGATLEELGIRNMADLLKFAEGSSMVNPVREGVVFKEVNGKQQFKAISNLYLEQEK